MDRPNVVSAARRALAAGHGSARTLLAALGPGERDEALLAAATSPTTAPLAEFHAELVLRLGSPELPRRILEAASARPLEGGVPDGAGDEDALDDFEDPRRDAAGWPFDDADHPGLGQGHVRAVLAELAALGASLPPLPFFRWLEAAPTPRERFHALRALASDPDPGRLRQLVEATTEWLESPFDAREWGEALSVGGTAAVPFLRGLLGDERPMVRLGAAFGLADLTSTDEELEVLADLVAFDPEPGIRVNAVELRSDSGLEDPYEVTRRLLTDPSCLPYFDGWLWSYACQALPPAALPEVLRTLPEAGPVDAYDEAELLALSDHPLAEQILRSRLHTADAEAQGIYLDALEERGVDPGPELLDCFAGDASPPRALVLRARSGDEEAQVRLLAAIAAGRVPWEDLLGAEEDLVRTALVPRVLAALADAAPEARARLTAHFRDVLPASSVPPPPSQSLLDDDPIVAREAALDLLESPVPARRTELLRRLPDLGDGAKVALLERLCERGRPEDAAVAAVLRDDPDQLVRGRARRLQLLTLPAAEAAGPLREALAAWEGTTRAHGLAAARARQLPLEAAVVRPMLFDAHSDVRVEAARLLAERESTRGRDWIREALGEERTVWVRDAFEEILRGLEEAATPRPSAR
jgi:hypothetical protein